MGLDMYLYRKISLWDYKPDSSSLFVTGKYNTNQHITKQINIENLGYLAFEIGYWRKANHIHKWFVDHVQDGNDDCAEHYVSKQHLEELYDRCLVIKDIEQSSSSLEEKQEKYEELLPTQSGFFFGNTNYTEDYLDGINETIAIIEKEKESEFWNDSELSVFYSYHSSW